MPLLLRVNNEEVKEVPRGVMCLFGISPEAILAEIDRMVLEEVLRMAEEERNA